MNFWHVMDEKVMMNHGLDSDALGLGGVLFLTVLALSINLVVGIFLKNVKNA
jgi:hypothetical protein